MFKIGDRVVWRYNNDLPLVYWEVYFRLNGVKGTVVERPEDYLPGPLTHVINVIFDNGHRDYFNVEGRWDELARDSPFLNSRLQHDIKQLFEEDI